MTIEKTKQSSSVFRTYYVSDTFPLPHPYCHLWLSIDTMFVVLPMMHLCLMTYDRYIAVTQPLSYALHRGCMGRIALQLGTTWLVSLIAVTPVVTILLTVQHDSPLLYKCIPLCMEHTMVATLLPYSIPACLMVVMYSGTNRALRRHKQLALKMAMIARPLLSTLSTVSLSAPLCDLFPNTNLSHTADKLHADNHAGNVHLPNSASNPDLPNCASIADLPNGAGNAELPNCVSSAELPNDADNTEQPNSADRPNGTGNVELPNGEDITDVPNSAGNADMSNRADNVELPKSAGNSADLVIHGYNTELLNSSDATDLPNHAGSSCIDAANNTAQTSLPGCPDLVDSTDMVNSTDLADPPNGDLIDNMGQATTTLSTSTDHTETDNMIKCPSDLTKHNANPDSSHNCTSQPDMIDTKDCNSPPVTDDSQTITNNDCVTEINSDSGHMVICDVKHEQECALNKVDSFRKAKERWGTTIAAAAERRRRTMVRQHRTSIIEEYWEVDGMTIGDNNKDTNDDKDTDMPYEILLGGAAEVVDCEGVVVGTNEDNCDKCHTPSLTDTEMMSVITDPGSGHTHDRACINGDTMSHSCDMTSDTDVHHQCHCVSTSCHDAVTVHKNSETEQSSTPDEICLTGGSDVEENDENDGNMGINNQQTPKLRHVVMAVHGLMTITIQPTLTSNVSDNGEISQLHTQGKDVTEDNATFNNDTTGGRDNLGFVGDTEPENDAENHTSKHGTILRNGMGKSNPEANLKVGNRIDNPCFNCSSDQIQACSSDTYRSESNVTSKDCINGFKTKQYSILRRSARQTCLVKSVTFENNDLRLCASDLTSASELSRSSVVTSHNVQSDNEKGSTFNYLLHPEEEQGVRLAERISEHRVVMQRILAMFVMSVLCNLPYLIALMIVSVCIPCWLNTVLVTLLGPFRWLALATSFFNQLIVTIMDPGIRQGHFCHQ